MVLSMTGYGSSRASGPDVEVEVSLRALNGRFLEIRCHLPREYGPLERDLKKIISSSIVRGTVDVYVQRRLVSQSAPDLIVNTAAAKKWVKAAGQLAKAVGKTSEIDLNLLYSQPEVMSWRNREIPALEVKQVITATQKALKACDEERRREGKAAAKHLDGLIQQLIKLTAEMETMAGRARAELGQRLEERLKKSPMTEKIEPSRLTQELALYVDRADVEEELHRLKQHLGQCRQILSGKEAPGKKLDFYVQELHREVNTIGSKSPLTEMTQAVVEAKALIEQIKEQVQNIV